MQLFYLSKNITKIGQTFAFTEATFLDVKTEKYNLNFKKSQLP